MVLFSSLNTALSGLQASMAALQTTGHNISNASTPGYSRQRVDLETQRPQDMTRFQIGRGVSVERISRLIDESLETRLRDSAAELANLQVRSDALQGLESLLGALSGSDIGTMLDGLFSSLEDFANNPDDMSTRSQVLENAATLTETLNYISGSLRDSRRQFSTEIRVTVDEVNRLADELASLNRQVLSAENAGLDIDSANDLRDRRDLLLRELGSLVGITAVETSSGEVNVLLGSAFLVFGGEAHAVTVTESVDNGVKVLTPAFADGSGAFTVSDGKLRGLLDSCDGVLGGIARDLDVLASALAYEFNRVQSTGQGLERFTDLTSLYGVQNPALALSVEGTITSLSTPETLTDSSLVGAADPTGRTIQILSGANILEKRTIVGFDAVTGTLFLDRALPETVAQGDRYQIKELPFPVVNGSFEVVLTNEITGTRESHTIEVDLDRVGADSTFADVVAAIDAIPMVSAELTSDNHIRIRSEASGVSFSFANDTSGFLAAAGVNVMFSGSTAGDIMVNPGLRENPRLLSGSLTGTQGDNSNALAFAAIRDLDAIAGGGTLEDFFQQLAGGVGVQAAECKNRYENQSLVAQQLENQRERISGVNIDEEAVLMIQYQRAYQASARFISVIDDLLDTLINNV